MKQISVFLLLILQGFFWGCAGAIDAPKGPKGDSKDSSTKGEPASDPVVVTGAYLACEDVTPKVLQGKVIGGDSEIACNLLNSSGVPVQVGQHIPMTAVLSVGQVYQEKLLDFTQTPHVKFVLTTASVLPTNGVQTEQIKIYLKDNQAAAVTVTIKAPQPKSEL